MTFRQYVATWRNTKADVSDRTRINIEGRLDHLGHSSIRVTSDRYGHLFPSARAALAESLDATFRSTHKSGTAEIRPKLQNPVIEETARYRESYSELGLSWFFGF